MMESLGLSLYSRKPLTQPRRVIAAPVTFGTLLNDGKKQQRRKLFWAAAFSGLLALVANRQLPPLFAEGMPEGAPVAEKVVKEARKDPNVKPELSWLSRTGPTREMDVATLLEIAEKKDKALDEKLKIPEIQADKDRLARVTAVKARLHTALVELQEAFKKDPGGDEATLKAKVLAAACVVDPAMRKTAETWAPNTVRWAACDQSQTAGFHKIVDPLIEVLERPETPGMYQALTAVQRIPALLPPKETVAAVSTLLPGSSTAPAMLLLDAEPVLSLPLERPLFPLPSTQTGLTGTPTLTAAERFRLLIQNQDNELRVPLALPSRQMQGPGEISPAPSAIATHRFRQLMTEEPQNELRIPLRRETRNTQPLFPELAPAGPRLQLPQQELPLLRLAGPVAEPAAPLLPEPAAPAAFTPQEGINHLQTTLASGWNNLSQRLTPAQTSSLSSTVLPAIGRFSFMGFWGFGMGGDGRPQVRLSSPNLGDLQGSWLKASNKEMTGKRKVMVVYHSQQPFKPEVILFIKKMSDVYGLSLGNYKPEEIDTLINDEKSADFGDFVVVCPQGTTAQQDLSAAFDRMGTFAKNTPGAEGFVYVDAHGSQRGAEPGLEDLDMLEGARQGITHFPDAEVDKSFWMRESHKLRDFKGAVPFIIDTCHSAANLAQVTPVKSAAGAAETV